MERAELARHRYARNSPFSYTCHACSRCCHDKIIQLNPYEVARLAQNRGISTTEFLARYTERSGTALRRTEEGACVFLTPQGCGVHQDRPLVCRLYPLGRHVTSERGEEFRELQPHPETEGEYGIAGTVQTFLDRQGADPFIEAADQYVELVGRLVAALRARGDANAAGMREVQHVVDESTANGATEWLDMDRMVAKYCGDRTLPVPTDLREKMRVHIQAIEAGLVEQSGTQKEGAHERG